jgi:hypothetical protein
MISEAQELTLELVCLTCGQPIPLLEQGEEQKCASCQAREEARLRELEEGSEVDCDMSRALLS